MQQRTRVERVIGFVLAIWGILFYSRLLGTMTEQFRVLFLNHMRKKTKIPLSSLKLVLQSCQVQVGLGLMSMGQKLQFFVTPEKLGHDMCEKDENALPILIIKSDPGKLLQSNCDQC